jgi:hypothetical protein
MYPICKIKVGVNISSLDTMQVSMDKYNVKNVKDIYTSMAHFKMKKYNCILCYWHCKQEHMKAHNENKIVAHG